ncbi:MAG: response regulator transcription factor [Bacteroidetes bacterium]|nr:response regulator transcription factor [Bacteroidota bacterium]
MKAIAIDDEPLALSVVERFCEKTQNVELISSFTDSIQGLNYILNNNIDLLFLDINIPHLSGLDLAKKLPKSVKVIFTTAYQDYALDGFDLCATDYLLKPFSYDRFLKAVNNAQYLYSLEQNQLFTKILTVKVDYINQNINVCDIIYIEGLKDYVKIHTIKRVFVVKKTMKSLEKELNGLGFVRIHKSYIINKAYIKAYTNTFLILRDEIKIPVGEQYKGVLIKK